MGYPILVIPCQHHTHELPAKHVTRLVSGRKTTGVGETIFLKYKASYNELQAHLETDPVPLKKFDWERYRGTPVEAVARRVLAWAQAALDRNQFARGDYKYAVQLVIIFLGETCLTLSCCALRILLLHASWHMGFSIWR